MRSGWAVASLCCLGLAARQTPPPPVQASPAANVDCPLGGGSVHIDYHHPAVRGRKIWGELVPFGQVWRAGANEATTIAFSDPVRVEGQPLAAGRYAFFAIPTPDQWTLIFNRVPDQWGAFHYQASQDALRVRVSPTTGPAQENLVYTIKAVKPDGVRVELAWDTLTVGFLVTLAPKQP
jgi:hypothetical protein